MVNRKSPRGQYTLEFKEEAVCLVEGGHSINLPNLGLIPCMRPKDEA